MFVTIIMKRTLLTYFFTIVSLIAWSLLSASSVFANMSFDDSRSLSLGNNTLTLYMGQDGQDFYLDAVNPSGKPLSCEIKAWNTLIQRSNCNDQDFSYRWSTRELKIYVQLDNDQGTWIYDTDDREFTSAMRGTTNVTDNNNSSNDYYDDDYYYNNSRISINATNTSPSTSQYVGLTIRVYNSNGNIDTNFDDEVRFTVSKLDNYGSYYTANSNDYYINNNRYTFSSYDDGYATLSNYLQFYNNGTYKVRVENTENGATSDVTIYVGGSSCSWCGNNNSLYSFLVEASDTTPSVNQEITTNITARDNNYNRNYDYQGTVRFYVERRDSTYGSRYTASTNDYNLSPTTTYMWSSQDGYVSLSDHITFERSWYYRLKAVDDNNSNVLWYREFTVGGSSFDNQDRGVSITFNTNNPSSSQYITSYTTIKDNDGDRDYDYQGTIRYVVQKRDGTYGSRYTASTNDYSLSSSTIYFGSNDDGYKTISSHIRFYNDGYYRLRAYDENNSSLDWYSSTINVGNADSNNNNSNNRFDLSTNDNTPWEDNFASLTIVARDSNGYISSSYNNRIRFHVYRRTYTSDVWSDITSSSLDNSAYRIYDTTYNFPSYNNGSITISNFIKFYSDNYDYKVKVVDDNNTSMYGEIIYYLRNSSSASSNNNSNSSSAYRFAGTLDNQVPSLNSDFDARVYARDSSNRTVTNYSRNIRISIERKALASSTIWTSASSSYCRLDRTSYSFSSSDYGYVTLRDIARCSKKWFYRLKFVDSNNSSTYGYIYFTIVDTNDFVDSLAWFTSSQRETTHELYRTFMSKVNERELNNATLARSSTWASKRRSYYTKLNALAYNKTGRLRNYSALLDAANDFTDDYNDLIR